MKEKESTLTKIETSTIGFNTLLQHFSTIKNEHPAYLQNLIPIKSVCSFSPLQTLSLIYQLFSFPTTHFPLIALKPTDEKESFSQLALVFDGLYKRLFLILCKDITLIMRGFFVSRNQTQSQTDRVHPCPIN